MIESDPKLTNIFEYSRLNPHDEIFAPAGKSSSTDDASQGTSSSAETDVDVEDNPPSNSPDFEVEVADLPPAASSKLVLLFF